MVTAHWSVSRWFRPVIACLILVGMVIGLNWFFSEMATALKQAVAPDVSPPVNFLYADNKKPQNPTITTKTPAPEPAVPTAAGRLDPFAPLAEDPNANGGSTATKTIAKDPLNTLQYTGMVNSRHPGGMLAMVQVNDAVLGNTTVIRKAGERLDLPNGQQAKLVTVSAQHVVINLAGKNRTLPLRPLLDDPTDTPNPATTPTTTPSVLGKPVALPTNAIR
jgi:hypothetical protein